MRQKNYRLFAVVNRNLCSGINCSLVSALTVVHKCKTEPTRTEQSNCARTVYAALYSLVTCSYQARLHLSDFNMFALYYTLFIS